jgi:hypothetical protein
MSHTNLTEHYKLMFSLTQHYNYTLTELDNLIPFEKEIYVKLLLDKLASQTE